MQVYLKLRLVCSVLLLGAVFMYSGCDKPCKDDCPPTIVTLEATMSEAVINEKLAGLESGWTALFTTGNYEFQQGKSFSNLTGITVRGEGPGTILSFEGQVSGGQALHFTNMKDLVVEDLVILNAKGDALKIQGSDGVTIRGVETRWDEPLTTNGAYGIYPVTSTNILIDDCVAYGASDAGIYVGQSSGAVISNSTAEANVAGIQVENSVDVEVFGNTVTGNTAGILAFDLDNIDQEGGNIVIRDNLVEDNNRTNFAREGTTVSIVPAGTGVMIMAVRDVDVHDNEIIDNGIVSVAVISYGMICFDGSRPCSDDVYFDDINIYLNQISQLVEPNPVQPPLGLYLISLFKDSGMPWILTDGVFEEGTGISGGLCIQDIEFGFVNLNILGETPKFDLSDHDCMN